MRIKWGTIKEKIIKVKIEESNMKKSKEIKKKTWNRSRKRRRKVLQSSWLISYEDSPQL